MARVVCWFVCALLVTASCSPLVPLPVPLQTSEQPAPRVSLTSRLSHPRLTDSRLLPPLPSPQELEAIKKVADLLVMLGEQVIPAIIGEPLPQPSAGYQSAEEPANDPVALDGQP